MNRVTADFLVAGQTDTTDFSSRTDPSSASPVLNSLHAITDLRRQATRGAAAQETGRTKSKIQSESLAEYRDSSGGCSQCRSGFKEKREERHPGSALRIVARAERTQFAVPGPIEEINQELATREYQGWRHRCHKEHPGRHASIRTCSGAERPAQEFQRGTAAAGRNIRRIRRNLRLFRQELARAGRPFAPGRPDGCRPCGVRGVRFRGRIHAWSSWKSRVFGSLSIRDFV